MQERIVLKQPDGSFLIGIGADKQIEMTTAFDGATLDRFLLATANKHRFCTLSYQLGFELLELHEKQSTTRHFPLLFCWTAQAVYRMHEGEITQLEGESNVEFLNQALSIFKTTFAKKTEYNFRATLSKKNYLQDVESIQAHIQQGNIYELNYCQAFQAHSEPLESIAPFFNRMHEANPTPFAAMIDLPKWKLAAASPERFLRKTGNMLLSQPIKGTAKRGKNTEEDVLLKASLETSVKERAENIMIVDLVRNDLSKIAAKGSVNVDELCAIYSYPTVHQMISTISCELATHITFSQIIEALFPMGSMTGAPKRAAVSIAADYESFSREMYSGSVGVIYPNNDFDFNVLIRTLTYHTETNLLECAVGGAITILSNPEEEYTECQTKIAKILDLFGTCQW